MKKCKFCLFTKADYLFGKGMHKCLDCVNKHRNETDAQTRLAVLRMLGGGCQCCGEREPVFLDLDHINNDGARDRKNGVRRTWRAALREPERFQLLCKNCNGAKQIAGVCPHQRQ